MTPSRPPGGGWNAVRSRLGGARPGRITNSLVILSSAAIVSVYAVGYARTQPAEDALTAASDATQQPLVAANASAGTSSASTTTATAPPATTTTGAASATTQATQPSSASSATTPRATATPKPTAVPTATPAAASGYRDGTYTGSGTSRHGGVTVRVVVSGGKITSAAITSCQTRYPCSQISSLQGQVISRQSAKIDHVSGATDSSGAYRQAVTAALAQAS